MRRNLIKKIMSIALVGCISFLNVSHHNVEAANGVPNAPEYKASPADYYHKGDYIFKWGHYPRTMVEGENLTDEIINAKYDDRGIARVGEKLYYRIMVDTENAVIKEGTAATDNKENTYAYKYFECEPIEWNLVKQTLDGYYVCADRVLDLKKVCENNDEWPYKNTDVREWLNSRENGGFISLAFSDYEQSILSEKTVESKATRYDDCYVIGSLDYYYIHSVDAESEEIVFLPTSEEETNTTLSQKGEYCDFLQQLYNVEEVYIAYRDLKTYKEKTYVDSSVGYFNFVELQLINNYFYIVPMMYIPNNIRFNGDVNYNGKVELKDASEVLKYALGIPTELEEQMTYADMDNSGTVKLNDALEILKLSLGINKLDYGFVHWE